MGNLRSLGQAVQLYGADHDSYPPAWVIGTPVSTAWCGGYYTVGGVGYMDVTRGPLWPYLQEKQAMWCKEYPVTTWKYPGSGRISSYGINSQYVAGNPAGAGMAGYAAPAVFSQLARPAETILFADCSRVRAGVQTEEIFVYPMYKYNSTARNYATFHFRHRARANAAFCDGHVDGIAPTEMDPAGDGTCGWMANALMDRD
jgi:prepilin-type processing-associated H-X9-DG protein